MSRWRLEAALYAPAPPRTPQQTGRPRLQGQRLPTLAHVRPEATTGWSTVTVRGWDGVPERLVAITSATAVWSYSGRTPLPIRWVLVRDPPEACAPPQALLCPDLTVDPVQLLAWFVLRWRLEVTWQEARAHWGLETQRPWNVRTIVRTTPARLGLFSIVTLMAGPLAQEHALPVSQAAWYRHSLPTVVDAIALVRRHVWTSPHCDRSPQTADLGDIPGTRLNRLTETRCYAA